MRVLTWVFKFKNLENANMAATWRIGFFYKNLVLNIKKTNFHSKTNQ